MRGRFQATLALAVVLHVGAIAAVRTRRVAPAPERGEPIAVEVILLAPASASAPATATASASASATATATATATRRATRTAPRNAGGEVAILDVPAEDNLPPTPHPVESDAGSWSAWSLATRPVDHVDLGGASVRERIERGEGAPLASTKEAGGLRSGLQEHDRALGLGHAGPVIAAAKDATTRSTAPVDGFAVFEATFDASGKVTSVRVVDVSADMRSWEDVAGAIKSTLNEAPLHLPAEAKGLAVTVRVDSRWQMPDGSDPAPAKVCVPPFPCNAGPHRKVLVISPLSIAGNLIPWDDGKPLRVVHARIVGERPL